MVKNIILWTAAISLLAFFSYSYYDYKIKYNNAIKQVEEINIAYKEMYEKYKEFQEERDNAKKEYNELLARINSKPTRVYIPVKEACTTAPSGETRAELDKQVVERILSVGRDGDEAIRELNYCIDRYNSIANGQDSN